MKGNYYCNCGKRNRPTYIVSEHITEVNDEKICIYCGFYACFQNEEEKKTVKDYYDYTEYDVYITKD